ncbi:MAG TPA: hypothetical protein VFR37_06235 [Longimicrobium sp.]|nr:hypothetical protein [Longimicrobium sp.]
MDARRALDEIESAHRAVGGTGRGRRFAVQQINQAYVVLLSSWFQAYCRDLHTECIDHLVQYVEPSALRPSIRRRYIDGRRLDAGNPNAGNIGSDFDRFGLKFWPVLGIYSRYTDRRQHRLLRLNQWRNAVAHQDFTNPQLGGRTHLRLTEIRRWRSTCDILAVDFERVMHDYLLDVIGTAPW